MENKEREKDKVVLFGGVKTQLSTVEKMNLSSLTKLGTGVCKN